MVVAAVMAGKGDVGIIVCWPVPIENWIVEPGLAFAWRIAQRSEPAFVLSTVVLTIYTEEGTIRFSRASRLGARERVLATLRAFRPRNAVARFHHRFVRLLAIEFSRVR
jgi:hypothetical protein